MNREEVDRIRDGSAAAKSGRETPWQGHYEEMGKKTVFRRAVKRLPISLNRELSNAIRAEDAVHSGRVIEVDRETGEILDVWADEPPQAPALPSASRLDAFASTEVKA
jgi:recombinational DNA repair protein RecT